MTWLHNVEYFEVISWLRLSPRKGGGDGEMKEKYKMGKSLFFIFFYIQQSSTNAFCSYELRLVFFCFCFVKYLLFFFLLVNEEEKSVERSKC